MKNALLSLLYVFPLFSSVNIPWNLDIQTGYCQEYLNWKSLTDTPDELTTYQEQYNQIKLLALRTSAFTIYRDIFFSLKMGGAFLGPSDGEQYWGELEQTGQALSYSLSTSLWQAYVQSDLGICVNLTPMRQEEWIIAPVFGIGSFWYHIDRKNPKPSKIVVFDGSSEVSSFFTKDLYQHWLGPEIGTHILIKLYKKTLLDFSYLFSWLKIHHKAYANLLQQSIVAGEVQEKKEIFLEEEITSGKGFSHQVGAGARYLFTPRFYGAFSAEYLYLSADHHDKMIHKKMTVQEILPIQSQQESKYNDHFIARLWNITFYFSLGVQF